ncbi:MAG: thiamine pyrophosphate-dependent dehydrogenase E1 component subunit alpha, partial [Kordiimonadaceae bacterium]|nr:thiamine pyrophosphate-dependent dehydrogenase E1 component subunit alpha [Kordiimonadaceae bacterium]
YYLLRTIRRTEEKIVEIYSSDKVKSPVHLSIGQEPIAVGVSMALRDDDVVFSNYRGHAHYLAKGGDLNGMWAELYGKENGMSAGKAGSMHLMDKARYFMPASAIVASAISNAVGYAMALKMRGEDRIVLCFHGEGAADEGVFWESMNFAALKKLPILFICENNGYAIYSKQKTRMTLQNIPEKTQSFGVAASSHSGEKTADIFAHTQQALSSIRDGDGPRLLEFSTYRWLDHVGPGDDHKKGFRDTQALQDAQKIDDIIRTANQLGEAEAQKIDAQVEQELSAALAFAEDGAFPAPTAMMQHIYAE